MPPGRIGPALSRRALLTGTVAGAGVATAGALIALTTGDAAAHAGFYGTHQAGIVTPPLPFLSLAGFDLVTRDRAGLVELLRGWTDLGARLTTEPARLTLTLGFGPSMFAGDRFGIADRRPAALTPLPAFPGEALDPAAGNGDLCVQACAATPSAAHHAVRALLNAGRQHVTLRWRQNGYRDEDGTADPPGLFGFRDGTRNVDRTDPGQTAAQLWADGEPRWLRGGTYLVMRRIRLLLDTWDRISVPEQEAAIGRRQAGNERITPGSGDPAAGHAAGPAAGHADLASAELNNGARILRRPYTYDAGVDPNGLMDAGLIFLSYQRDPHRQFVPIQRRLAERDPLNGFSQHLASGVYACPPGARPGSFLGAELFS